MVEKIGGLWKEACINLNWPGKANH